MQRKIDTFYVAVVVGIAVIIGMQIYAPNDLKPLANRVLEYPGKSIVTIPRFESNIPRVIFSKQSHKLWQPFAAIKIAPVKTQYLLEEDARVVVKTPDNKGNSNTLSNQKNNEPSPEDGETNISSYVAPPPDTTPITITDLRNQTYTEINGTEALRYGDQISTTATFVDQSNAGLCNDGGGTISGTYCAPNGDRYNVNLAATNQAAAQFNQALAQNIVELNPEEIISIANSQNANTTTCSATDLACAQKLLESSIQTVASQATIIKNDQVTSSISQTYLTNQKTIDYINLTDAQIMEKYGFTNKSDLLTGLTPTDLAKVEAERAKQQAILASATTTTTESVVNGQTIYTITTTYTDPETGKIVDTQSTSYYIEQVTQKEKIDTGFIDHNTTIFRDAKTGNVLDATTESLIKKTTTQTYKTAGRSSGGTVENVQIEKATYTDAYTGELIATQNTYSELSAKDLSKITVITQTTTAPLSSNKITTTTKNIIDNPNYVAPVSSTTKVPTGTPFTKNLGDTCDYNTDCSTGLCGKAAIMATTSTCQPNVTNNNPVVDPQSCKSGTILTCRGGNCTCLTTDQSNSLTNLEKQAGPGNTTITAVPTPELLATISLSRDLVPTNLNNYAICNGDVGCNTRLTAADSGLSHMPGWIDYRDAYINSSGSQGNQQTYWENNGYTSLTDCENNSHTYLSKALCKSEVGSTQDQLSASIKLGTNLTSIGAAIGSLPLIAASTAANGALGTLTTTLTRVGGITTMNQTGNTATNCLNGSTTCTRDLAYTALSWANLGTMEYVSNAFATGVTSSIKSDRLLNSVVSGVNLITDGAQAVDSCFGENASGLGCTMSAGAVIFDGVGGFFDYRTGQLIYSKLPENRVNTNALLALGDTQNTGATKIALDKAADVTPNPKVVTSISELKDTKLPLVTTTLPDNTTITRINLEGIADPDLRLKAENINSVLADFKAEIGYEPYPAQVRDWLGSEPIIQLKNPDGTPFTGKTDVLSRLFAISEPRTVILTKGTTEATELINSQFLTKGGAKFFESQNTHAIYIDSKRGFLEVDFSADLFKPESARVMSASEVESLLLASQNDPGSMHLTFIGDRANTVWTRLGGNESTNLTMIEKLLGQKGTTPSGVVLKDIATGNHGQFLVVADEISEDIKSNLAISGKAKKLSQIKDSSLLGGLDSGNKAVSVYEAATTTQTHLTTIHGRELELTAGQSQSSLFKTVGDNQSIPVDINVHAGTMADIIDQSLTATKSRSTIIGSQLEALIPKLRDSATADAAIKELDNILAKAEINGLTKDLNFRKSSIQEDWNQLARVPGSDFAQEGSDLVLRKSGATTGERLSTSTQLLAFYDKGKLMLEKYSPHLLGSETVNLNLLPKSLGEIKISPPGSQMNVTEFYLELIAHGHEVRGLDATPKEALNALYLNGEPIETALRPTNLGLGTTRNEVVDQLLDNRKNLYSKKATALTLAGTNVDMEADLQTLVRRAHEQGVGYDRIIVTQYRQSPDGKAIEEYLEYEVKNGVINFEKRTVYNTAAEWNSSIQGHLAKDPQANLIVFKGRERGADLKVTALQDNIRFSQYYDATGTNLPTSVNAEQMWRRDRTFGTDFDIYLVAKQKTLDQGLTPNNIWEKFFVENLNTKMANDRLTDAINSLGSAPKKAVAALDDLPAKITLNFWQRFKLNNLQKELAKEASSFEGMLHSATAQDQLTNEALLDELYRRSKSANDRLLAMAEKIGKELGLSTGDLNTIKKDFLKASDNFPTIAEFRAQLKLPTTKLEAPASFGPADTLMAFARNNTTDPSAPGQYRVATERYLASSSSTAPITLPPVIAPTSSRPSLTDSIANLLTIPTNALERLVLVTRNLSLSTTSSQQVGENIAGIIAPYIESISDTFSFGYTPTTTSLTTSESNLSIPVTGTIFDRRMQTQVPAMSLADANDPINTRSTTTPSDITSPTTPVSAATQIGANLAISVANTISPNATEVVDLTNVGLTAQAQSLGTAVANILTDLAKPLPQPVAPLISNRSKPAQKQSAISTIISDQISTLLSQPKEEPVVEKPSIQGTPIEQLLQDPNINLSITTNSGDLIEFIYIDEILHISINDNIYPTNIADAIDRLSNPEDIESITINGTTIDQSNYTTSTSDISQTWNEDLVDAKHAIYLTPNSVSQSPSIDMPSIVISQYLDTSTLVQLSIGAKIPLQAIILINDKQIQINPDTEIFLKPGDVVTFGDIVVEIEKVNQDDDSIQYRSRRTTENKNDLQSQLSNIESLRSELKVGNLITMPIRSYLLNISIRNFEAKVKNRYENIEKIYNAISQKITNEPDASRTEILDYTLEQLRRYPFTNAEINNVLYAINSYVLQHEKVEQLKKDYPTKEGLWTAAFGVESVDEINIQYDYSAITFTTSQDLDFARAYAFGEKVTTNQTDQDLINKASSTNGFHLVSSTKIKNTQNIFNVSKGNRPQIKIDTTVAHENQHNLFKVVERAFRAKQNTLHDQRLIGNILEEIKELAKKTEYEDYIDISFDPSEEKYAKDLLNSYSGNIKEVNGVKTLHLVRKVDYNLSTPQKIEAWRSYATQSFNPETSKVVSQGGDITRLTNLMSQYAYIVRRESELDVADELLARTQAYAQLHQSTDVRDPFWFETIESILATKYSPSYNFIANSSGESDNEILATVDSIEDGSFNPSIYILINNINDYYIVPRYFKNIQDKTIAEDGTPIELAYNKVQSDLTENAAEAYEILLIKGWTHESAKLLLQTARLSNWLSVARKASTKNITKNIPYNFFIQNMGEVVVYANSSSKHTKKITFTSKSELEKGLIEYFNESGAKSITIRHLFLDETTQQLEFTYSTIDKELLINDNNFQPLGSGSLTHNTHQVIVKLRDDTLAKIEHTLPPLVNNTNKKLDIDVKFDASSNRLADPPSKSINTIKNWGRKDSIAYTNIFSSIQLPRGLANSYSLEHDLDNNTTFGNVSTNFKPGDVVHLKRRITVDRQTAEKIKNDKQALSSGVFMYGESATSTIYPEESPTIPQIVNDTQDQTTDGALGISTSLSNHLPFDKVADLKNDQVIISYDIEIPAEKIVLLNSSRNKDKQVVFEFPDGFSIEANDPEARKFGYMAASDEFHGEGEITFLYEIPAEYIKDVTIIDTAPAETFDRIFELNSAEHLNKHRAALPPYLAKLSTQELENLNSFAITKGYLIDPTANLNIIQRVTQFLIPKSKTAPLSALTKQNDDIYTVKTVNQSSYSDEKSDNYHVTHYKSENEARTGWMNIQISRLLGIDIGPTYFVVDRNNHIIGIATFVDPNSKNETNNHDYLAKIYLESNNFPEAGKEISAEDLRAQAVIMTAKLSDTALSAIIEAAEVKNGQEVFEKLRIGRDVILARQNIDNKYEQKKVVNIPTGATINLSKIGGPNKDINRINSVDVAKYKPQLEWFNRSVDLVEDGFHAIDHITRVWILQETLADLYEQNNPDITIDREALRWAAALHDVRLDNDEGDDLHGEQAAVWVQANFKGKLSKETLDKVVYLIRWHVPSDDKAPKMTPELAIFKDADGLERVRLGDLDTTYLRTKDAKSMASLAEKLYLATESFKKQGYDSYSAVVQSGLSMGLLANNTDSVTQFRPPTSTDLLTSDAASLPTNVKSIEQAAWDSLTGGTVGFRAPGLADIAENIIQIGRNIGLGFKKITLKITTSQDIILMQVKLRLAKEGYKDDKLDSQTTNIVRRAIANGNTSVFNLTNIISILNYPNLTDLKEDLLAKYIPQWLDLGVGNIGDILQAVYAINQTHPESTQAFLNQYITDWIKADISPKDIYDITAEISAIPPESMHIVAKEIESWYKLPNLNGKTMYTYDLLQLIKLIRSRPESIKYIAPYVRHYKLVGNPDTVRDLVITLQSNPELLIKVHTFLPLWLDNNTLHEINQYFKRIENNNNNLLLAPYFNTSYASFQFTETNEVLLSRPDLVDEIVPHLSEWAVVRSKFKSDATIAKIIVELQNSTPSRRQAYLDDLPDYISAFDRDKGEFTNEFEQLSRLINYLNKMSDQEYEAIQPYLISWIKDGFNNFEYDRFNKLITAFLNTESENRPVASKVITFLLKAGRFADPLSVAEILNTLNRDPKSMELILDFIDKISRDGFTPIADFTTLITKLQRFPDYLAEISPQLVEMYSKNTNDRVANEILDQVPYYLSRYTREEIVHHINIVATYPYSAYRLTQADGPSISNLVQSNEPNLEKATLTKVLIEDAISRQQLGDIISFNENIDQDVAMLLDDKKLDLYIDYLLAKENSYPRRHKYSPNAPPILKLFAEIPEIIIAQFETAQEFKELLSWKQSYIKDARHVFTYNETTTKIFTALSLANQESSDQVGITVARLVKWLYSDTYEERLLTPITLSSWRIFNEINTDNKELTNLEISNRIHRIDSFIKQQILELSSNSLPIPPGYRVSLGTEIELRKNGLSRTGKFSLEDLIQLKKLENMRKSSGSSSLPIIDEQIESLENSIKQSLDYAVSLYKSQVQPVHDFLGVGKGADGTDEFALKPVADYDSLIWELSELEKLGFLSLNPQILQWIGERGIHITIAGETGIKEDQNTILLQNSLIATGYAASVINGQGGIQDAEAKSDTTVGVDGQFISTVYRIARSVFIRPREVLRDIFTFAQVTGVEFRINSVSSIVNLSKTLRAYNRLSIPLMVYQRNIDKIDENKLLQTIKDFIDDPSLLTTIQNDEYNEFLLPEILDPLERKMTLIWAYYRTMSIYGFEKYQKSGRLASPLKQPISKQLIIMDGELGQVFKTTEDGSSRLLNDAFASYHDAPPTSTLPWFMQNLVDETIDAIEGSFTSSNLNTATTSPIILPIQAATAFGASIANTIITTLSDSLLPVILHNTLTYDLIKNIKIWVDHLNLVINSWLNDKLGNIFPDFNWGNTDSKTINPISRIEDLEILEAAANTSPTTHIYVDKFINLKQSGKYPTKSTIMQNILNSEEARQDTYLKYARQLNLPIDTLKQKIQNTVEQVVSKSNLYKTSSIFELEKVLLTDGRFKNQVETGTTSSDTLDPDRRIKVEKNMFGYDADIPAAQRPIYGYLSDGEHGVVNQWGDSDRKNRLAAFGSIVIEFNTAKVANKTTISFHDSLQYEAEIPPTPYLLPHFTSLSLNDVAYKLLQPDELSTSREGDLWFPHYVEAQFHNQLFSSDIKAIHISKINGMSEEELSRAKQIYQQFKTINPESSIELIEY